ncbi:MAG: PDZ domain-containing protein [Planctomycetota bacterium]|nr:PDZ domain-containing protein [Planctomycetota bacterium]
MRRHRTAWACVAAAAWVWACAPAAAEDKDLTTPQKIELSKKLVGSLVRVEYTFQLDKGDEPSMGGRYIVEERPLETAGFVVSPTQVVAVEIDEHHRFIQSIRVRCGDQLVDAKVTARFKNQDAVVLTTSGPLKATPLVFDAKASAPYYALGYALRGDEWTVTLGRYQAGATRVGDTGRTYIEPPDGTLVVDKDGKAVGFAQSDFPVDDSWKGSPLSWPLYSDKEVEELYRKAQEISDRCVVRVGLSFRSPKKEAGRARYEEESRTEQNVLGVIVEDDKVLVLAPMRPRVTARLQRVTVYPPTGSPVAAAFAGTLRDYGCFVAKLSAPMAGKAVITKTDIHSFRDQFLLKAQVQLQEERRLAYFSQSRIASYTLGWKRLVHPQVREDDGRSFLFSAEGELVAMPLSLRPKVSADDRDGRTAAVLMPADRLRGIMANLAANLDKDNVPLTEEEEDRVAWLGVELQPLTPDLARANNISDVTRDGRFGAIVSHVYPGSPAATAGVQIGAILLQLQVEGEPRPIEVQAEDHLGGRAFPWAKWDQLPEQYYDEVPTPWPPVENALNRKLTDLGFGRKFTAEFVQDGKKVSKDFVVTPSPSHYGTARKFKAEALGLTVREMTYEMRRYFRTEDNEPGLVVSKLEPGSRASVSGIKPFEVITHVNDQPVSTAAQMQDLVSKTTDELKLTVKRMTVGTRQVKIAMKGELPATRPGAPRRVGPATAPAPAPQPPREDE